MASRPAEQILAEARRLVDHGHRELVLTGIHLGHYGVDSNSHKPKSQWNRLSTLLRQMMRIAGQFRVRLSSIEATEVTHELLSVMADHADRICPHLHVCLQSGSDRVLRRMRRRWGSQRFLDRCARAREVLHKPALTTDVIVGFPGETDDDFQQTCDVVAQIGFSKVHIFPFSPRRGTPASEFADQVPAQVKAERSRRLAEMEGAARRRYFEELVGETLEVLVEAPSGDDHAPLAGTACRYAPVKLAVGAGGELVRATVERVDDDGRLFAGCR
jgi:threonylcarbamoyladenosine tRNA methylthiotransferase MtaB